MRAALWLWKILWPLKAKRRKGLAVGDRFPAFSLADLAGISHQVPSETGQFWTVLWFTNLCEDCRQRAPLLEELRLASGGRFGILAVSLLGADETLPRQAAASCGFPILLDPQDVVAQNLGLEHPPQTCPMHNLFILDREGRIIFRHHLSALKPEAFRHLWKEWLRQASSAASS